MSVLIVGIAWEQLEFLGSERIYRKLVEEEYEKSYGDFGHSFVLFGFPG